MGASTLPATSAPSPHPIPSPSAVPSPSTKSPRVPGTTPPGGIPSHGSYCARQPASGSSSALTPKISHLLSHFHHPSLAPSSPTSVTTKHRFGHCSQRSLCALWTHSSNFSIPILPRFRISISIWYFFAHSSYSNCLPTSHARYLCGLLGSDPNSSNLTFFLLLCSDLALDPALHCFRRPCKPSDLVQFPTRNSALCG